MGQSSAERVRSYRQRQKATGGEDTTRRNSKVRYKKWYDANALDRKLNTPFVGCDGEGAGKDDLGRQHYMLFRMGERELYTGQPLTTYELLDFICDDPGGSILVGFSFGYDVTMILRDLSEERQRRLLAPRLFGEGKSPFTWWRDFDIDYLPRQFLRVRRIRRYRDDEGEERREAVKGTTRTIWETFGFFQKSFVKCCRDFKVCSDEVLRDLEAMKNKRGSDEWVIDQAERDYCALECTLLEELMSRLRTYCAEADIHPRSWSGAGKLAEALHRKHETPRAPKSAEEMPWPKEVEDWANMAYYGGRFEITTVGHIEEQVYEYDIGSAYPDSMRKLPCLVHGKWSMHLSTKLPDADLYIAAITYKKRNAFFAIGELGGFPCRTKSGHLCWPRQSAGVYWSPEIRSAIALGHDVKCVRAWVYEKQCDCKPFDWIEPLYDYRKSIGSQGAGYPIKLGINSLYGKLAQRRGHGVYVNMIWAGLITAYTRSTLNQAIKLAPDNVLMLATDAIYTTKPLPLDIGPRLGQWEESKLPGLFIVQPGLYWSPGLVKRKSRGLSGRFFEENNRTEIFEQQWRYFLAGLNTDPETPFPSVPVEFDCFIGMRLALARNKPDLAGTWLPSQRKISFDYRNKRSRHIVEDGHLLTGIRKLLEPSLPHKDFLSAGGAEPWENARLELAEQPDYIDLGPPWSED